MQAKTRATAQKLLNLYRQAHVIVDGWATVNQVFIAEANDTVIQELNDLPTGKLLVRHIQNLRDGKTQMDTIDRELLPYAGMMTDEQIPSVNLTATQWTQLERAINDFVPNEQGLEEFLANDIVKHFGEEWVASIQTAIKQHKEMSEKWAVIKQTYNAYRLWRSANEIISTPLTERARASVQADMPEYETYLPMFGAPGDDLLVKLRTFISTMN